MIIVRHGEDIPNLRGGWSEAGLTERGVLQAKALGMRLYNSSTTYERIITSDLPRAKETAEIINSFLHIKVVEDKYWREIDNGDLRGIPKELSDKIYPNLYLEKMGIDQCYPNGESPRMLYERISYAFSKLKVQHDDNTIIVTHGGPIMVVLHMLLGIDWVNERRWFRVKKCGVVKLKPHNNTWVLEQYELQEN